ncbi:MAG TPA: hypothetical protein VFJ70_21290 [Burkholderiales bacterium]|nr:hypothetical protein [Burkholderiales bacterium]
MKRRHLFDNGYPVANATLVAGSEVLLAIARQSLRKSSLKLVRSFLLLADSSGRVLQSLARCGCTHAELRETRDNYVYIGSDRPPSAKPAGQESQNRPARAPTHHR